MKLPLIVSLVALLACVPAAAGSGEAVIAAEHARGAALLKGDAAALGALLSDDLRYIHSSGRLETKSDVVSGIASGKTAYERFVLTNLDARPVSADVVVLTGAIDQRKLGGGKWSEVKLLFHAVWRNEAGVWRQVSLQTLQVPARAS